MSIIFFKVPQEIQKLIFNHMELNELIQASKVNKQWNQLANGTEEYQKKILGYQFLQINSNPQLAEKFSLIEAVYGYLSAKKSSLQNALNACEVYSAYMKDKISEEEIKKSISWALDERGTLEEKNQFLHLIIENPVWVQHLSVSDAAEICILAGDNDLATMKYKYKALTGKDINLYWEEYVLNAMPRVAQSLIKEAKKMPFCKAYNLTIIISNPKLSPHLSVEDAAEICILAGDKDLAIMKFKYKNATGKDINLYIEKNVPNAMHRIVQALLKETKNKASNLSMIISNPRLIHHLSVEDAAEMCINAGNLFSLNAMKHNYKSLTGRDIDETIKSRHNLKSSDANDETTSSYKP